MWLQADLSLGLHPGMDVFLENLVFLTPKNLHVSTSACLQQLLA